MHRPTTILPLRRTDVRGYLTRAHVMHSTPTHACMHFAPTQETSMLFPDYTDVKSTKYIQRHTQIHSQRHTHIPKDPRANPGRSVPSCHHLFFIKGSPAFEQSRPQQGVVRLGPGTSETSLAPHPHSSRFSLQVLQHILMMLFILLPLVLLIIRAHNMCSSASAEVQLVGAQTRARLVASCLVAHPALVGH